MAKYKMCKGLAISPEKDMQLLKDMSKKGWHLSGMSAFGFLYRFEQGEPCDYDYALNMEKELDQDMLAYYEASGWSPIVVYSGLQIFRAKEGTTPIFTDQESEEELIRRNKKTYGIWASIFALLLVGWIFLIGFLDLMPIIDLVILTALIICFLFTFLPFLGFCKSLFKFRKTIKQ